MKNKKIAMFLMGLMVLGSVFAVENATGEFNINISIPSILWNLGGELAIQGILWVTVILSTLVSFAALFGLIFVLKGFNKAMPKVKIPKIRV